MLVYQTNVYSWDKCSAKVMIIHSDWMLPLVHVTSFPLFHILWCVKWGTIAILISYLLQCFQTLVHSQSISQCKGSRVSNYIKFKTMEESKNETV